MSLSIILPAKNEAVSLKELLPKLKVSFPDAEIIVVNDGSTDNTVAVCESAEVKVVTHLYSKGNGSAIKSGARAATGDVFVFLDADGQHQPKDIERLLQSLESGYDMVVGARGKGSQASLGRALANGIYNKLATKMTGHKIEDLTSGFRAVKAKAFKSFLTLLPNGFSYPTTITMAFFRAGYSVGYIPITALKREGQSHIKPLKDGFRFLLIIFKVATLYSPLKLFVPVSLAYFFLGFGHYMYNYLMYSTFTNMSALLFSTAVIIFLIGLISEQVTTLIYQNIEKQSVADAHEKSIFDSGVVLKAPHEQS